MQMLLVALAGCAAMDIVLILARQRQDLRDLVIEVKGWRVDATPAPFERIHIRFTAHGDVELEKLKRAVELGVTKYCSVVSTLKPEVAVEWEALVAPSS
jgi:putative redox protein